MPSREYHEAQAVKVFGKPWTKVHAWLDEFAIRDGRLDLNHHRHRHHLGGVQQVERLWGETAAAVARQHIKDDEGQVYTEDAMKKIYPDCPEWKTLGERKREPKDKGGL